MIAVVETARCVQVECVNTTIGVVVTCSNIMSVLLTGARTKLRCIITVLYLLA